MHLYWILNHIFGAYKLKILVLSSALTYVNPCTRTYGLVTNYGEEEVTEREGGGGHVKFYPYEKVGRGHVKFYPYEKVGRGHVKFYPYEKVGQKKF